MTAQLLWAVVLLVSTLLILCVLLVILAAGFPVLLGLATIAVIALGVLLGYAFVAGGAAWGLRAILKLRDQHEALVFIAGGLFLIGVLAGLASLYSVWRLFIHDELVTPDYLRGLIWAFGLAILSGVSLQAWTLADKRSDQTYPHREP